MAGSRRLDGRLKSRWVRVDGQEMHYLRSVGPSPAFDASVVLLQGMTSGRAFERVGELLAPYYRVYIPDMPGLGESEQPSYLQKFPDLVRALEGWMRKCGLYNVHVAAQSFGCNMAVEAAIRHPELVSSLTLQGPTLQPERRGLFRLFPFWLASELRELPRSRSKKRGQSGATTREILALGRAMLKHPIEHRLPLVHCPAQVMHGTHDLLVSRAWARQAVDLLPSGHLREIPYATHTMNARQPEAFADGVLAFIGHTEMTGDNDAT